MSNNPDKSQRPSSADYPVNPEERSNQQTRLRKAAAAGASTSKSPISALNLQLPPAVPATQNVPEPQTTRCKTTAPTETAPEPAAAQSAPQMAGDDVLAELRKISAWADSQRKMTKWLLASLAGLVPIAIVILMLINRLPNLNPGSNTSPPAADWYEVDRNVRMGDFEKAIATGEELILKMPQSPEAHARLARAYLAAGKLEKAKEHFAEAFRLFPSEENEKLLNAIEKRIRAESP
jgi:tetratricopeptide (TPR) repeat protein